MFNVLNTFGLLTFAVIKGFGLFLFWAFAFPWFFFILFDEGYPNLDFLFLVKISSY